MRRPDHVTDARAEQSKSAQNKKSGTEITHYRRPRPKPVPDHLVPSTPSLTDIAPLRAADGYAGGGPARAMMIGMSTP